LSRRLAGSPVAFAHWDGGVEIDFHKRSFGAFYWEWDAFTAGLAV
jgi:hypothetical protein